MFSVTPDDLKANREGRLSLRQQQWRQGKHRGYVFRMGLFCGAYLLLTAGLIFLSRWTLLCPLALYCPLTCTVAWFHLTTALIYWSLFRLWREGQVLAIKGVQKQHFQREVVDGEEIEGEITDFYGEGYLLELANEAALYIDQGEYDQLAPDKTYTFYYWSSTEEILSVEAE